MIQVRKCKTEKTESEEEGKEEKCCCSACGRESVVYCDMCGVPLCEECGNFGLCSTCAELWEDEIDLEDMEAEEE